MILLLCFIFTSNNAIGQTDISGWVFKCQREAIAPLHHINESGEGFELILHGGNKAHASGAWVKRFPVSEKTILQFMTQVKYIDIEEPHRSILANIIWLDDQGKQLGPKEFPSATPSEKEGLFLIKQIYQVPKDAKLAEVHLWYRWDADGKVAYQPAILTPIKHLPERKVSLAAVHHQARNSTTEENLSAYSKLASEAGRMGADIVCLPEAITLVGTGKSYVEAAESVPGPTTQILGEVAKKHQMYIVAGLLEKAGEIVYNTAVFIGRDGELSGKYRKVSLPREEIEGGITPGESFPVFETDFGKIGIMICWDLAFPEPARELAKKGAEIIFLPVWGGNENLAKARAIENQIYLVSSTYDTDIKTGIYDLKGDLIAQGLDNAPIAMIEVDLDHQVNWPWLGEFKNRIWQEMPSQSTLDR